MRFGLVSYRDHPPEEDTYVVHTAPFTSDIVTMKQAVDCMEAMGGGDGPEALADGLRAAYEMAWRPEATKVVVVVTDAPPHGVEPELVYQSDGFPGGCPCGVDPLCIAHSMAACGIAIYTVGAEPTLSSYVLARDLLRALSRITAGQFVPLTSASLLTDVIIGSALEEIELSALMEQVQLAATANVAMSAGTATKDDVARNVTAQLQGQCVTTTRVVVDDIYNGELPELDPRWTSCSSVTQARELFGRSTKRVRANIRHPHAPPVPARPTMRSFEEAAGSVPIATPVPLTAPVPAATVAEVSGGGAQRAAIMRDSITLEQVTRILDKTLSKGMFS